MTLDPIGPRSAGMDNLDRLDAARGDGVKEVQLPKIAGEAARAEAPPAGPEVAGQTSPLTPAETGAERLGESKFQGMMVRENLLSGAHDPALSNRLARGVEVQDRLNLGAAEPALAHQLDDIKGRAVQEKVYLAAAETALAQSIGRLSEAGAARESGSVWSEKLRSPDPGTIDQKVTWDKDTQDKSRRLEELGDAKIHENLRPDRQSNIWGERLESAPGRRAELEIQDKLSFPKQIVSMIGQKLESETADKDLQIQDKLSFPKQVVSMIGQKLEDQAVELRHMDEAGKGIIQDAKRNETGSAIIDDNSLGVTGKGIIQNGKPIEPK